MTRLKDLVHRSALRTRSAGDSEVGLPIGMDYQVFEITDLTIPAGTDWSSAAHVFGSAVLPASGAVSWVRTLELAAAPGASTVTLRCDGNGFALVTATSVTGTDLWNERTTTFSSLAFADPADTEAAIHGPISFAAQILTDGPTAADITIVRARVAFLVA